MPMPDLYAYAEHMHKEFMRILSARISNLCGYRQIG
jgi:hypothetical protein